MDMLKKVWEGNERLVITFWVWGFVGGWVVNIVVALLLGVGLIASLVTLPYLIFIWFGIWRSSDNYKGQSIWALLAKIVVVLGVVGTIYNFINPTPMPF